MDQICSKKVEKILYIVNISVFQKVLITLKIQVLKINELSRVPVPARTKTLLFVAGIFLVVIFLFPCDIDNIDFKNYIRDILDARCTNVAAENELVSDEKESHSWTTKLATLEEKINALSKENEHLKGEIPKSYTAYSK